MKGKIIPLAVVSLILCTAYLSAEEKITARHILFAPSEQEKAEEILEKIKNNEISFEQACEDYSTDTYTKRSGGVLGPFTRITNIAAPLKNKAFSLKEGEYASAPVKTQFGWHIIQVLKREGEPVGGSDDTTGTKQTKEDAGKKAASPFAFSFSMEVENPDTGSMLPYEQLEMKLSVTNTSDKPAEIIRSEFWVYGVSFSSGITTEKEPTLKEALPNVSKETLGTVLLQPGQGMFQTVVLDATWENLNQEVCWEASFSGEELLSGVSDAFPEDVKALQEKPEFEAMSKQLSSLASAEDLLFDLHSIKATDEYYVIFTLKKGGQFLVKIDTGTYASQALYFLQLVKQNFYKDTMFHKREADRFISGGGTGRLGTGWPENGKYIMANRLENVTFKEKDFILAARRTKYSYECGSIFIIAQSTLENYADQKLGLPIGQVAANWSTIAQLSTDTNWRQRRQNPIVSVKMFTREQLPLMWAGKLKAEAGPVESDEPLPQAVIETGKGTIKLELYEDDAPNTVANFISLAEDGFYDGLTFHRVVPGFVTQGGDPQGTGRGGPGYRIKAEVNARKHVKGALGMARSSHPDSAGSQFYICLDAIPHLDSGYTVFGMVTEGMDVVEKIEKGDSMKTVKITRKRDHEYTPEKL